jgi:hypothetical protein
MKKTASVLMSLLAFAGGMLGCDREEENSYTPCECEGKQIIKILKDEPAYIVKGCYDYFNRVESFSIVLINQPLLEGLYISQELFPCGDIPEEYKADSILVLISGNITDCVAGNQCLMAPNVRIIPTNLFELTSIKRAKK